MAIATFPTLVLLLILDLLFFFSFIFSPYRLYHPEWKNFSLVTGKLSGKLSYCSPIISGRDHDRLDSSSSPVTIKQYTHPLKSWWDFRQKHQITPFFLVGKILEFLSQKAKTISSYSFNTTRFVISLISDSAIGNPLVKRLNKKVNVVKSSSITKIAL